MLLRPCVCAAGACVLNRRKVLILEYTAGGSLHDVINSQRLVGLDDWARIGMASGLVSAMRYLHESKPPLIARLRAEHVFLDAAMLLKLRLPFLPNEAQVWVDHFCPPIRLRL